MPISWSAFVSTFYKPVAYFDQPLKLHVVASVAFLFACVVEYLIGARKTPDRFSKNDLKTNSVIYIVWCFNDLARGPAYIFFLSWFHQFSPFSFGAHWWRFDGSVPLWHWAFLLIAGDFVFYWMHRCTHRFWLLWTAHVVHHSSRKLNLSTSARQPWTNWLLMGFGIPFALMGFDPSLIVFVEGLSMFYQAIVHSALLKDFGPFDLIFNSPSHHRVHHALHPRYFDKNFGAIFIIWDKLFGTFVPEGENLVYGTGYDREDFHPVTASLGEYVHLFKGVRAATGLRKITVLFEKPHAIFKETERAKVIMLEQEEPPQSRVG